MDEKWQAGVYRLRFHKFLFAVMLAVTVLVPERSKNA
jgi:hypothetical protein